MLRFNNHPHETVKPPSPKTSSRMYSPAFSSNQNSCSFSRKTCPQSARAPIKKRMSKTLYMRTSCTELRETTKSFAILIDCSQHFIQTTVSKILIPSFPILLQNLTTSFDKFSNQLVSLFSTIRKTPIVRNFGQNSLMFQSGELFTNNWISFIEYVNDVADNGLSPYQEEFTKCFQTMIDIMSFMSIRMKKGNFNSKEAHTIMRKNNSQLLEIHEKLNGILLESNEEVVSKINQQKYTVLIKQYVRDMNTIMDRILPNDVISPIESSKIRSEISAQCAEICQIIESMCSFHECISSIKTQIVDFNSALSEIYKLVNLPFSITLTVEEKEDENSQKNSKDPKDLKNQLEDFKRDEFHSNDK